MKGIDENGRLFGVVNVIDAVAVVIIVTLVVSVGAVFIATSSDDDAKPPSSANDVNSSGNANESGEPSVNHTSMVVQFQLLNDAPYVVKGIDNGSVPGSKNIVAVLGTSRTKPIETGNNTTSTARLRLRLNVTEQQNRVAFEGNRLYIGKTVRLDLGTVVVDAIVTDIETNRTRTTHELTQTRYE